LKLNAYKSEEYTKQKKIKKFKKNIFKKGFLRKKENKINDIKMEKNRNLYSKIKRYVKSK